MNKRTTISVSKDVYEKICKKGKFGETFTEILSRLVNEKGAVDNEKKE